MIILTGSERLVLLDELLSNINNDWCISFMVYKKGKFNTRRPIIDRLTETVASEIVKRLNEDLQNAKYSGNGYYTYNQIKKQD